MTILIGCDPEVFLKDSDNTIISSIGLIGAGKDKPLVVEDGAVLEDNVLAEINIIPAQTSGQFISRISKVLKQLTDITHKDIEIKTSHNFTREELLKDEKALEFGCDRDMNVYTGDYNPKPNPFTTLRTAGGHIHVGAEGIDLPRLVRTMDLYLGVPSVLMDNDKERRQVYGTAGCYRPKDYGLEYRVLSNFWLRTPELMQWAYDQSIKAVNDHKTVDLPEDDILVQCINNSDESLARSLI